MGPMKWEPNLSTSRLARIARASRGTVCDRRHTV
jgi:hypothetical protein